MEDKTKSIEKALSKILSTRSGTLWWPQVYVQEVWILAIFGWLSTTVAPTTLKTMSIGSAGPVELVIVALPSPLLLPKNACMLKISLPLLKILTRMFLSNSETCMKNTSRK